MNALHLEAAEVLVSDMRAALDAADLARVDVTLDGRRLAGRAIVQRGAVLVQAPSVKFETFGEGDPTFTAIVAAGPADRELDAWRRIDRILTALLAAGLPITEASPAYTQPVDGPPIPAYEITVTST